MEHGFLIRQAQPADAEELAFVSVASWKSAYKGLIPDEYWDSVPLELRVAQWQKRLEDSDRAKFTLLVKNSLGQIIGYCGGLPERTGNTVYTGEIGDLYLLESSRRRGIGRILMAHAVERLRQQGHGSMLVWAFTENRFKAFYENLGGQMIDRKTEMRAGQMMDETAYGWLDLTVFSDIMASQNYIT